MRFLLVILLVLGLGGAARAQDAAQAPETALLDDMLSGAPLKAEQFTPELLAQVPLPQLQAIVNQIRGLMGTPSMVQIIGPGQFLVVSETHQMPVQLTLNTDNVIVGVFFSPPVDLRTKPEDLLAGLAGGDSYAYLVTRNGEVLYSKDADVPMAVGSAFKLGVLAVLRDGIHSYKHSWDEVATLGPEHLSLPTGILQTWGVGAPVTLHTLSVLMISQSDNTATDLLMLVVGREAVQAKLGLDSPPLATAEFFKLKANPALLDRYRDGDADEKAAVLTELAALPLPAPGQVTAPHQEGAEWYLPLTTLCAMMDEVAGLDATLVNPGVAQPGDWRGIAFKGGSEVGVLNLTTGALAHDGDEYCLSVTWNDDAALNEQVLSSAYATLLSALSRQPD